MITPGGWMRLCENGAKYGVCNWIVPANSPTTLCPSCRLNRTIPDLSTSKNLSLWGKMEVAKRRLIGALLRLGFTLPTKAESPAHGLAFDMVSNIADPKVTIGHLEGVITVNVEEADDTYRQINRQQLGENTRTLVGHFRHEMGHYMWLRWLSPLDWAHPHRQAFRERFGNEWDDYSKALSSYYQSGAATVSDQNYITAYASSHPWEDWAETWAHYLQILDGLETCESFGVEVNRLALPPADFPPESGELPKVLPHDPAANAAFLSWLGRWCSVSVLLNESSASLGQPAPYPFVITPAVACKLRLVHYYVSVWGNRAAGTA